MARRRGENEDDTEDLGLLFFSRATESCGLVIDYSLDAILQHLLVEVDQQSDRVRGETEVSEQLHLVNSG